MDREQLEVLASLRQPFTLGDAMMATATSVDPPTFRRLLAQSGYFCAYERNGLQLRRVWRSVPRCQADPVSDDDNWQCGSDQQIAILALLLIDQNRIADIATMNWLESQITAAGPRFCRQMTERLDGSNEVPF